MKLRIATFNVENLFVRPRAMNFEDWGKGQPYLDDYYCLNSLLYKEQYSAADKKEMLKLLKKHKLLALHAKGEFLEFRDIRGQLIKRPKGKPPVIVANGRGEWLGWLDLKREAIEHEAIRNTARVIVEVNPDILALVEVENRPALQRFHNQVLEPLLREQGQPPYRNSMVIDGNDDRGIDVGVLSRWPIQRMRSHITDGNDGKPTFSRDCPEYYVALPDGQELVILPNHFASKGSDRTGKRRKVQAQAVKAIYVAIRKTHDLVVVAGDLNDYPENGSLDALIRETDLQDAMSLPVYNGYPGTYRLANKRDKIDYLLLSPALAAKVTAVDCVRRGYYAPTKWEHFENLTAKTKDTYQASDHHCLWADIAL